MSVLAGPYSPARLYGVAGNVPRPSVLLLARLYMYEPVSETLRLTLVFTFKINWFWLYRPADSISATTPGLPSGKTPLPGTAGLYVPGTGALMSCDRNSCSP